MKFVYTGRDNNSKKIEGIIEAPDLKSAIHILNSKEGFLLINIFPYKTKFLNKHNITDKEMRLFLTQLEYFLRSGVNIVMALETLSKSELSRRMRMAIRTMKNSIEQGSSLTHALEATGAFSNIFINMCMVGEETGRLTEVINFYRLYFEDFIFRKRSVIKALIYPVFVMLTLFFVSLFMSVYIFPKFIVFFNQVGVELPQITRFTVTITTFLRVHLKEIILLIVGIIFTYPIISSIFIVRRYIDYIKLNLPIVNFLEYSYNQYCFISTFEILYRSGVSIIRISELLPDSVQNVFLKEKILRMRNLFEKGEGIYDVLKKIDILPDRVLLMIKNGENTGNLNEMLKFSKDMIKEELDYYLDIFIEILNPLLLIVVAIFVAFFVISIVLPILNIIKAIRKI